MTLITKAGTLTTCALLLLSGCTTIGSRYPFPADSEPAAGLTVEGGPVYLLSVDAQGCYSGKTKVGGRSEASSVKIVPDRPLTLSYEGSCMMTVGFTPKKNNRYEMTVSDVPWDASRAKSFLGGLMTSGEGRLCTIRLTRVGPDGTPLPAQLHKVSSGQKRLACIQFDPIPLPQKNFLFDEYRHALAEAERRVNEATSDREKASALNSKAVALDSLNRQDEALGAINEALTLSAPDQNSRILATKAGILFQMDEPRAALDILAPQLATARRAAATHPEILDAYTEHFITATFSYIRLEQWRNAIDTLRDARSSSEGASFSAYRSLVYRYIMARAHDSTLADSTLEKDADYYAQNDKSHYGVLLKLWSGSDVNLDVDTVIGPVSNAEKQEAMSEVLFYSAAYDKFVKGDVESARAKLAALNQLAPSGSIEWTYGNWVLP